MERDEMVNYHAIAVFSATLERGGLTIDGAKMNALESLLDVCIGDALLEAEMQNAAGIDYCLNYEAIDQQGKENVSMGLLPTILEKMLE